MNFGEWEAKLVDNFDLMLVDMYLTRRTTQGREALTSKGTIVQIKDEVNSDNLRFARLERGQLQTIAEAFAQYGVKTIDNHRAEGLLEATKYHLEDLRVIAKLKPKPTPELLNPKGGN